MDALFQDVRSAVRSFRRRPLLFASAAAALALGIGASVSIFSVVDAVLLRSLPFEEPDRLLVAWTRSPQQGQPFVEVSYPDFLDWRAQSRMLSSLAAMPAVGQGFTIMGREPVRVQGRLVSGNFFEVLGARAWRGRTLEPEDDQPAAARVVVLSHGLWQRQFGSDPGLVGRSLVVDGTPMVVAGIMPPEFRYPPRVDLWTPVVPAIPQVVANRDVAWAIVVGRLAKGSTLEEARTELDGIVSRLSRAHHPKAAELGAVVTPLAEELFGPARPSLLVLLLAVLCVLLVACANVAALLMARAGARQREIAVRLALGASRARLARQLLAESVLIAVAGGLGGALLAAGTLDALVALVPAEVPRLQDAAIDARVLAFAVALTALAAVTAGLVPAFLASKPSLTEVLADEARSAGPARYRPLRSLLIGAEVAVALVLLCGAGLLARSFQNLRRVDLGFDSRDVLTLALSPPRGKYRSIEERRRLGRAVLERIDAVPGVQASGLVLLRPLGGTQVGLDWPFTVEGQSEEDARRNPLLNLEVVTPGYFRAMRIRLLRGRTFTERDDHRSQPVVVVSEAVARRYWPGQDPVGRRMRMPLPTAPYPQTWMTVVGVVGEARYREIQAARLDLYMSSLQSDEPLQHAVVRTSGDPLALVPAVKAAVQSVDRELVTSDVTTMDALVQAALGGARFSALLLSGFALTALALAALGTYGVVAFVVGRRTREIGVRMALGARAADVLRLVLRQGMAPVAGGVCVGLAGSLALGRALSGLLFGVRPHDLATLAGAAAVLAAAALVACSVPALRAARIDPACALREQ
jgi:putative ABC transport system permease protein